jgi:hypothetical protein
MIRSCSPPAKGHAANFGNPSTAGEIERGRGRAKSPMVKQGSLRVDTRHPEAAIAGLRYS